MDYEKQKEKLIDQLKKSSGISFEISETDLSEDEVIAKLKEMVAFCNSSESKNGFLISFLEGGLKKDQAAKGFHQYHIEEDAIRVPYLLESKQAYPKEAITALKALLASSDIILEMDVNKILIVRRYDETPSEYDIEQSALELIDMMGAEAYTAFCVAYDGVCTNIYQFPNMYENLSMAMSIGNIFSSGSRIFSYQDLGLGRLLYNIPPEECKAFFGKRLDEKAFMELDEETIHTLNVFFDNDLSIAETSRQLFLHRNTLIYKLDKFQSMTGLDVRKFRDATACKIALMLVEIMRKEK